MISRLVSTLRYSSELRQRHSRRRVVLTGIGLVSPIGIGKEAFWNNLLAGETGIGTISQIDASGFPSQIAAEVRDFDPKRYLTKRQIRYYSRSNQFAVAAFKMAKEDAAIEYFDPERTDVILGSATCALAEVDRQVFANPTAGRKWVDGSFDPQVLGRIFINGPACAIALIEDIQGHVTTLSSACASTLNAIGMAAERIKDGRCDVAISGGTDCAVNYFSLNSFCASDSLSTENDKPNEALCPMDLRRTKSVLGEASVLFILEEYRHAKMRGARIYAELSGYAQNYENTNELYLLDQSGKRWSKTIRSAVEKSRSKKIDYINAHAPSDTIIDRVEASALREALGTKVAEIPISSIKGAVGSPLGTAGGLQIAASALALHKKMLPPSRNYKVPDPDMQLQVVAKPKHCAKLKTILVNGHGFGGVNASVVLESAK